MTESPRPARTHDQIRQAIAAMLQGTGLHIEQRPHELIITNPADPEKGQICIGLDDGYVTWERTITDYWGHLDGITTPSQDTPTIPVTKIIQAVTSRM